MLIHLLKKSLNNQLTCFSPLVENTRLKRGSVNSYLSDIIIHCLFLIFCTKQKKLLLKSKIMLKLFNFSAPDSFEQDPADVIINSASNNKKTRKTSSNLVKKSFLGVWFIGLYWPYVYFLLYNLRKTAESV